MGPSHIACARTCPRPGPARRGVHGRTGPTLTINQPPAARVADGDTESTGTNGGRWASMGLSGPGSWSRTLTVFRARGRRAPVLLQYQYTNRE